MAGRPDSEISRHLADRLRAIRKDQSLSLDRLAELSGLSRSMLSQIERGESSPTVASLWALTEALSIDFAQLLDGARSAPGPIREVLRRDRVPVIDAYREGCRIRILGALEDVGSVEIYQIAFEPGATLVSAPHGVGCVEHLTVLSGTVTVTSGDAREQALVGDVVRYAADLPHAIEAEEGAAEVLLIVMDASAAP